MITLQQIKAARAMLGLSQQQLADKAGISIGTLNNLERGTQNDPKVSTMYAIRQALEKEGIEFTVNEHGDISVRLKAPAHAMKKPTILIIDDSESDRTLYKIWLNQKWKYTIIEADNAQHGYDAFIKHQPSCIILDFMMYGTNGFQLLVKMKAGQIKMPPIVFMTAMSHETLQERISALGIDIYLDKNHLTQETLCATIERILA